MEGSEVGRVCVLGEERVGMSDGVDVCLLGERVGRAWSHAYLLPLYVCLS